MSIKILRSTTANAPATLGEGQLAYSHDGSNGGILYIGRPGTAGVDAIGGLADHTKLAGIEAGAQVNIVTSVATKTGAVSLVAADLSDFSTAADARIAAANLDDLVDVTGTPSDGQVLTYVSATSDWRPQAIPGGVNTFIALNDTPVNYTGSGLYFVRVNSGATALEFTQDIDDGTF